MAPQIIIDELDPQIKPEANEKLAMSITETCSKIYKPKSYDKAMNNPIYGCRWHKTIENKLQNLENYQTWEYDVLPLRQKAIRSKWVFKVKYNPNSFIAKFKARLVA